MQMSEGKVGATKSSNTSVTIKLSYNNRAEPSGTINNHSMTSHVTSKNDSSSEHHNNSKRSKKKHHRDKQPPNDAEPTPAVMPTSSYSLIDDDHIDDQETINVGNLIIDLESSLEKEKIENEQANNNIGIENKSSTNGPKARSPTSLSTESEASVSSFTSRQRAPQYEQSAKPSVSDISSTKECGTSTSIGTITEPECLGPCKPGTSVTLEGIVWQETDGGILVVNVTWRGKTYVGALLDCTRHDWAPSRLCDSPASDIDSKANKGVRAKRIVTRSNGIGLDEKNLLQTTGKLRNGKGRRILPNNEPGPCNKKQREATDKVSGESSSAQIETANPISSTPPTKHKESPEIPEQRDSSSSSSHNNVPKITDNLEQRDSSSSSQNNVPKIPDNLERRDSSSSSHNNAPKIPDLARASPDIHQRSNQSLDPPQGHQVSTVPGNQQMSSSSIPTVPTSRSSSQNSKQSMQQQPPLPATTEEGMKPSGTSTGPPPAPHQANCYFNPAFLANTFNPYNMQPHFPRHLYDQMTPPAMPAPNAAFLTRFMNNMKVPQPSDSPSRMFSPSMPKNVPFPPFKMDPMPGVPPLGNPPLPPPPPVSLPPMPPLSLGGPPLRMPSREDLLLPPSSQAPPSQGPYHPSGSDPNVGNPLGPFGGPVDDLLAKQFPRRFN